MSDIGSKYFITQRRKTVVSGCNAVFLLQKPPHPAWQRFRQFLPRQDLATQTQVNEADARHHRKPDFLHVWATGIEHYAKRTLAVVCGQNVTNELVGQES